MVANGHNQGVILVIKRDVGRQLAHEPGPYRLVGLVPPGQTVTGKKSSGVGVDHEAGLSGGVKDDAVGRLRADALDGQQGRSEPLHGSIQNGRPETAGALAENEADQFLEATGFDVGVTGRANGRSQTFFRRGRHGLRRQQREPGQFANGFFRVPPSRILSQDGADHDFEGAFGRPPASWSEIGRHLLEEKPQLSFNFRASRQRDGAFGKNRTWLDAGSGQRFSLPILAN